jgi:hypothetical protein
MLKKQLFGILLVGVVLISLLAFITPLNNTSTSEAEIPTSTSSIPRSKSVRSLAQSHATSVSSWLNVQFPTIFQLDAHTHHSVSGRAVSTAQCTQYPCVPLGAACDGNLADHNCTQWYVLWMCVSVCLCLSVSVFLSVCLSVFPRVSLSVCLSCLVLTACVWHSRH